jgi:hypothetical protein
MRLAKVRDEVKDIRLERETESRRLERLKKVLQAKIALSQGKPPVGNKEMSANR